MFEKEIDINRYDKHLISKHIFIFFTSQENNIYIFRSFIFGVIKLLK